MTDQVNMKYFHFAIGTQPIFSFPMAQFVRDKETNKQNKNLHILHLFSQSVVSFAFEG